MCIRDRYGYYVSEPFASGEIYISTMLDTLMCQAFYNPYITSILDQMIMGGANLTSRTKKMYKLMNLQQSNLFLINIPPEFNEKTFGALFDHFALEKKMIAIGLYRGEKTKKNNRPYVFIKPDADIKLEPKDKVYVLSGKQPEDTENPLEQSEKYGSKANLRKGTTNFRSRLNGEEGRIDVDLSLIHI
eukprot:TRINITY_DN9807_c0_g2_i5.p1 TRINITY_DN9807_c0_g2~~TRINITY_DN9807_c0_g2_i5.p1  ORF type:complete len:188 (-),score=53.08 TRINITY_DN9807_c0_g2_i5:60-623(-)